MLWFSSTNYKNRASDIGRWRQTPAQSQLFWKQDILISI